MAAIRKRGDKWQVQVRRKGCPPQSRSFSQKADAQAWARSVELQADRGELSSNAASLTQLTLGDLIRRYLQEVVPRKRSSMNEAPVLKAFLRQKLSYMRLANLASAHF